MYCVIISGSPVNKEKLANHQKMERRKELERNTYSGNSPLNRVRSDAESLGSSRGLDGNAVVLDDVSVTTKPSAWGGKQGP